MTKPEYLSDCAPLQRTFPLDWKVAYFRLNGGSENGYACPLCQRVFRGAGDFDELHGDHVIPYSAGGRTTWENLQLLCGSCNLSKSDRVPLLGEVRPKNRTTSEA